MTILTVSDVIPTHEQISADERERAFETNDRISSRICY